MASEKKTRMVSLRMTERQYLYLNTMASKIKSSTGFKITRASIILKLMEYGLPYLDKEFPDREREPNEISMPRFL